MMQRDKLKNLTKRIQYKIFDYSQRKLFFKKHNRLLSKIYLQASQNKTTIIYPPTVDWNISLFQRPQHLALQLSMLGYLFFFSSPNYNDWVNGFHEISRNLYLTNRYDLLLRNPSQNWILISSTNRFITYEDVLKYKALGFKIIYDYIDEITPEISPIRISLDRHKRFTDNDVDLIIATADTLHNEMLKRFPPNKVLYVPNGVDYLHFHKMRVFKECPHDLKNIVEEGKPIIGYYGAFAKWIDYTLLNYLSERRKDWNLVLIGPDYDGSAIKISVRDNIKYLGIKKYVDLPNYAIWFDVAIIPFSEGRIAKATSPLKLYEYMAMNKPVVVTKDLIECHKYQEVLVGQDQGDFIQKVDEALRLSDDVGYMNRMDSLAKENTWEARAKSIDKYLMAYNS